MKEIYTSIKYCKYYFFTVILLLSLVSIKSYSQTTLIDPSGNGGFETGTTFALNGWTVVNGSNTNRVWYVGTAHPDDTGTRCAFIGNSTTTIGTNTNARTVHFYRSITIPTTATYIQLKFKYKQAIADDTSGTIDDYIAVYTNNAAPTNGTLPGGTRHFGPYPSVNTTSFTEQTISLPTSLATGITTNLIFTFNADNGSPHGYGAIDDIELIYYTSCPNAPSSLSASNISTSSATINWTAASSTPTMGYDYYFSTNNTAPSLTTIPTGNVSSSSSSVNISGLNDNTTYYVWVRSNCGTGKSNWIALPSFTTLLCAGNPSGLTTDSLTDNSITVLWSAASPAPANGYEYYFSTSSTTPNSSTTPSGTTVAGTTSVNLTGLTDNTTYYFWVRSVCTSTNKKSWIALPSFTTPLCAGNPSGLTIDSLTDNSITVLWSAASPAPANGYEYYFSTSSTTPNSSTTPSGTTVAGTTSVNLTGLTDNTTYYFWVRSVCTSTNKKSWIALPSFTTLPCAGNPTNITIATLSNTSATLVWEEASPIPANGYEYYYSTSSTTPTSTALPSGSTTTGVTTISLTGLNENTLYYFWVRSVCSSTIKKDWTPLPSFKTYPCSGNPTNLVASSITSTTATINWTASEPIPATGYEYHYNTTGTPPSNTPTPLISVSNTTTNANLTGLTSNSTYYVWVRAVCTPTNKKSWIGPLIFSTGCAGNPTNIYSNIINTTSATISWTAGNPAPSNGYHYYFSTTDTAPTSTTTPTGSTMSTSTTLTGLTAGTNYYIWIRSRCSSSNLSWIGPLQITMPDIACASSFGTGTGTSTFGCANVLAGGLGITSSGDHPTKQCFTTGITPLQLEAKFPSLGETTSYTVEQITYAPPYQFDCLRNPISVNIDDKWSPIIYLPFNFCFYGNSYNKCLVGSNGVLTFDITNNTPGGTNNWSYCSTQSDEANLPVANHLSLVTNAIFGVGHDINPGAGGRIGWELITLDSGCRALVVAFNNVPMFSNDTTNDYTGMMVLYENTNIIEVYIKKKRITTTTHSSNGKIWNDGNAVVGIQDATGTLATVAPGRNVLDTNWTADNEAWRFTPSGASIASVKWFEGPTATGTPINIGSKVITVSPLTTSTYTAEVTFTFCNGAIQKETDITTITINGTNKTWNGSVNKDWSNANNWTPVGVPTNLDCVTIPDIPNTAEITGTNYKANAYNVKVNNSSMLELFPTNSLVITDGLTVETFGTFNIKNSANLVQINNTLSRPNSGNINMDRTATNLKAFDYIYWSSPVANFPITSVSPQSLTTRIYQWIPDVNNGVGSPPSYGYGNWSNTTENMVAGKGYAIRVATANPSFSTTFSGAPNNGIISKAVTRGPYTGPDYNGSLAIIKNDTDNWNFIGNPYPSAIDALEFLTANNTVIEGEINLWTHNSAISTSNPSPYYQSFGYNYKSSDYITYNLLGSSSGGSGSPAFNGSIAAGQGFFVKMLDGAASTQNIVFNNAMRTDNSNNAYNNSQFYRTKNKQSTKDDRSRIWMDILDSNLNTCRFMFGYTQDATNEKDHMYDASTNYQSPLKAFSLLDNEPFVIQGKGAFQLEDKVNIGFQVPAKGNYKFAISETDGLFKTDNVKIYLEDLLTNTIHDLTQSPYNFSSEKGLYKNRFIVRYTTQALSNNENEFANSVTVYNNSSNQLVTVSELFDIKEIVIYDILGKTKTDSKNINTKEFISTIKPTNSTLLVKVTLENGVIVTKKVIY